MDEEAPKDEIEVVIEETPEPEKQAEPEVEAKTEDQAEPEKQEIPEVEAKTEEPEKQEIPEVEAKTEEPEKQESPESPEKEELLKLRAELDGLKIESLIVKNLDKLTPKLQAHLKTIPFDQAESLVSVLPSLNQTQTFTAPAETESKSDLAERAKILSRLTGLNQESLLANLKGKNEQI